MYVTEGSPEQKFIPAPITLLNSEAEEETNPGEVQKPEYGMEYGTIICEKAKLRTPVYYGDGVQILEKGAGQYAGGKMPGTLGTILIGGHDTTYFEALQKVGNGDGITIQTDFGEFTYSVNDIKIIEVSDEAAFDLQQQEREILILYTCYPFGELAAERNQRYLVFCERRGQSGE